MQVSDRLLPRVVEIATEALHSEKNILMVAGPAGAGGAMFLCLRVDESVPCLVSVVGLFCPKLEY